MIETLDDIIEGLADRVGIYGACDEPCSTNKPCRICWTSNLRDRILTAIEIERQLKKVAR
jgi:hypothetical protein